MANAREIRGGFCVSDQQKAWSVDGGDVYLRTEGEYTDSNYNKWFWKCRRQGWEEREDYIAETDDFDDFIDNKERKKKEEKIEIEDEVIDTEKDQEQTTPDLVTEDT